MADKSPETWLQSELSELLVNIHEQFGQFGLEPGFRGFISHQWKTRSTSFRLF